MSNKRGTMSKPWRRSTPPSIDDIRPRRKQVSKAGEVVKQEFEQGKDEELKVITLDGTTYVPKTLWDTAVEAIEILEKQVKELNDNKNK